jgi:uncharacterized protein
MSQQDVQTMQRAYEAFNRGDIPAVLEAFAATMEWYEPGGGNAPQGVFHGPQSVADDVFALVPQHFAEFAAAPEQFIDAGTHVVVSGHFRGRGTGGQPLDTPFVHVWEMQGGKATRFANYMDAAAWARAWGG